MVCKWLIFRKSQFLQNIFRSSKITYGELINRNFKLKLGSDRRNIHTVLVRDIRDCKRKLLACPIAILYWNMLVKKEF
jgi:hypothetical protein